MNICLQTKFKHWNELANLVPKFMPNFQLGNVIGKFATNLGLVRWKVKSTILLIYCVTYVPCLLITLVIFSKISPTHAGLYCLRTSYRKWPVQEASSPQVRWKCEPVVQGENLLNMTSVDVPLELRVYTIASSFTAFARAFFNYITGGGKAPSSPHGAPPPLNHFGPPSRSPFSLKYKQNMEFRREVWYSSNRNLLCESMSILSFNFI
jgi:hypothetical protein